MPDDWYAELCRRAEEILPAHVLRYFLAGAMAETTRDEAGAAWSDYRFRPRVLCDVRAPALATSLLGASVSSPIGISPTSMQRWAHADGELAMAQAAREADVVLTVSSNAGTSFAEIGAAAGTWWLQAYLTAERELIAPVLANGVAAGAGAIVLTVDTPFPGPKRDIDHGAFGELSGFYGVNHPEVIRGRTPGAEHAGDLGLGDISWLRETTGVPIVVKGVLRGDDARRCVDAGASAVWVSNHGGRQLDRDVATAHALPEVVGAVGDDAEVYVDGGISSGLDVLTALALGARGVFCGRLPLLALADGAPGVSAAIGHLTDELGQALALAGRPDVRVPRDLITSRTTTL